MKSVAVWIFVSINCCTIILSIPIIPSSILEANPGNHVQNDTRSSPKVTSMIQAVEFMKKFGYLSKGDGNADSIISREGLRQKLKMVQKFGAIPQTGELDAATFKLMNSPRCGVEDVDGSVPRRRKRFIVGSGGWNKRRLTYYIANWSGKLWSKENVQRELRKAFDEWAKYSYMEFTEVNNNQADIIIFFATYDHQDGYPFDGMGGTLAHAYYPYEFDHYGGDIHFDDSEDWAIKPKDEFSGLEFFSVAVHEIGHSLGLAHSPVQNSIMFPYYKGHTDNNFALGYDDILGMWELYIRRRLEGDDEYFNTTTQQPSTTPSRDGFQKDEPVTTSRSTCSVPGCRGEETPETSTDYIISYHGDSKTVDEHEEQFGGNKPDIPSLPPLLPDDEVSRRKKHEEETRRREEEDRKRYEDEIRRREEERRKQEDERRRYEEERKRQEGERRRREEEEVSKGTTSVFPSTTTKDNLTPNICEGRLDSIAKIRGEIIIFKGKFAWRYYRRKRPVAGNPSLISSLFQGLPVHLQKVDAVYERKNDSNIIFFIGKHFYVHDGRRLLGDALPISNYGVPDNLPELDAVFLWAKNNRTYLFSRNLYWRRDDTLGKIDDNYPLSISRWNGIPQDLDAAVTDEDGITHFLRGDFTWSYDNQLVAPNRYSPQRIKNFWFSC